MTIMDGRADRGHVKPDQAATSGPLRWPKRFRAPPPSPAGSETVGSSGTTSVEADSSPAFGGEPQGEPEEPDLLHPGNGEGGSSTSDSQGMEGPQLPRSGAHTPKTICQVRSAGSGYSRPTAESGSGKAQGG